MKKVFIRTPYNYDVMKASIKGGLACPEITRTQQQFAEEADINNIVGKFLKTGLMPQGAVAPSYAMFEDVFDFQSAQNALIAAEKSFMAVPAEIRKRFDNDPQLYLEFCTDEKNLEEMRTMGLAIPKKKEDITVAPVA